MSHIVEIQTEVRDASAVEAACHRLQLPPPRQGTFQLYASEATGLGVELRGWRYPLVCKTETGQLAYDNYRGHWGDQAELNRFVQAYGVEKCRLEARKQGHTVSEQLLDDGSVKLTVQVGGAT